MECVPGDICQWFLSQPRMHCQIIRLGESIVNRSEVFRLEVDRVQMRSIRQLRNQLSRSNQAGTHLVDYLLAGLQSDGGVPGQLYGEVQLIRSLRLVGVRGWLSGVQHAHSPTHPYQTEIVGLQRS